MNTGHKFVGFELSLNRYMVECKLLLPRCLCLNTSRLNRYMVECKYILQYDGRAAGSKFK